MKAVLAAKKAASKAKALKVRGSVVAAKGVAAVEKVQVKGQALADKGQSAFEKGKEVASQSIDTLLPQPIIKSDPNINMSETTIVRDPKLVSVVNKLKAGKIETEIGYPQVGLTVLLGIFFVAITALGIDKYNKCVGIQGSKKYQNLKSFMSHTMAIAIAIPCILLLQKFVSNEGGVFTIIYAIMGLTASAIAMDIMRQPECKDGVKSSDKNFAIMSLVGWIILLLAGSFFTFKKYPKLGEVFKKKNI